MAELASELDTEQKMSLENATQVKRLERKVRELTATLEEERKNQLRASDTASQLHNKINAYKKQIEETEEIASLNLAKFRRAQHELAEVAGRADQAEAQLARQRAFKRSSASLGRESSPPPPQPPQRAGSVVRR